MPRKQTVKQESPKSPKSPKGNPKTRKPRKKASPKSKTRKLRVKAETPGFYDVIVRTYPDTSSHIGIHNPESMCYMITSLQMLYSMPEYLVYILAYPGADPIIMTIKDIFTRLFEDANVISIKDQYVTLCNQFFKDDDGDVDDGEQDPGDFLSQLLEYIEERYPGSIDFFKFNIKSKFWCDNIVDNKEVREPDGYSKIWPLQMTIDGEQDIQTLINNYSNPEPSDIHPPNGCTQADARYTSIHIDNTHTYLIIQLVRFITVFDPKKKYPDNIKINKNLAKVSIPGNSIVVNGLRYNLSGTIKHLGRTPNSGHYHYYNYLGGVDEPGILYDDKDVYSRQTYIARKKFDPSLDHGDNTRYLLLFKLDGPVEVDPAVIAELVHGPVLAEGAGPVLAEGAGEVEVKLAASSPETDETLAKIKLTASSPETDETLAKKILTEEEKQILADEEYARQLQEDGSPSPNKEEAAILKKEAAKLKKEATAKAKAEKAEEARLKKEAKAAAKVKADQERQDEMARELANEPNAELDVQSQQDAALAQQLANEEEQQYQTQKAQEKQDAALAKKIANQRGGRITRKRRFYIKRKTRKI